MGIFTQNNLPSTEESLKKIEEIVLGMGATTFVREFDGDNISSLYFTMEDKLSIRLPLCIETIENTLKADYRTIKRKEKLDIREESERIATAELARYIETVSTLVKLGQTTLKQSLLAFSYDQTKDQTFYEMLETKGMKFLDE